MCLRSSRAATRRRAPLLRGMRSVIVYGLRADRDYRVGERVTTYNGHKSVKRADQRGDYVAESGDIVIDSLFDFLPTEKGRWINESDRERSLVNVNLARTVRATQKISAGEWIFADYGDAYQRLY